ncbi:hypothetical protein SKAU_G00396700 [Synaphobranchus kaupii]|uniref:Interleukin-4 n=1 Tax=Synaphobranchus kaupii TaxID=118154 RepID=A0A9Q1ECL8_SYNKA|nr:hypothetical protein SKAU_G00396700 [Synaphobranchus kaupii]
MQSNDVKTFLGLTALCLLLATSALGAPTPIIVDELLHNLDKLTCNENFHLPDNKDKRSSMNCFINELDSIRKNCTTTGNLDVSNVVYTIKQAATFLFKIADKPCQGNPGSFEDYIKAFKNLVEEFMNDHSSPLTV